jgi:endonuclease YncB( thermonuclease family)
MPGAPTRRKSWGPVAFACVALAAAAGWFLPDLTLPSIGAADENRDAPSDRIPFASSDGNAVLVGRARIVDGDTIEIQGQRVRLFGIDAPEMAQTCRDARGEDYRCGLRATLALAARIGGGTVTCDQRDVDRYQRIVAVCSLGGEELNGWLVREGYAVSYRRFSTAYVGDEEKARAERRGLWSGGFVPPEDWRQSQR